MPDNESSGDDNTIRRYATWQAEIAGLLHADGLRGAFCRFATGNIRESQYALLKPIFNAMIPGDIISPNEYSEAPGYQPSSAGHLARYENMWVAAGKHLETVIGEAGICVGYDPGKGYQSIGMSGSAYGQQMLNEDVWYENGKIDRCLYLIGGYSHESFRLGDDVLDFLENHYVHLPVPPKPPDPPTPIPPTPIPPTPKPPVITVPVEFVDAMITNLEAQLAVMSRELANWRDLRSRYPGGLLDASEIRTA